MRGHRPGRWSPPRPVQLPGPAASTPTPGTSSAEARDLRKADRRGRGREPRPAAGATWGTQSKAGTRTVQLPTVHQTACRTPRTKVLGRLASHAEGCAARHGGHGAGGTGDPWGQASAHLHCPEAGRSHASVQPGQPCAASEAHGVPSCPARRSPAEKELVRRTGVALRAGRQGGHPAMVTRPQAASPAASQEAVWPTRHHPHLCVHDGVTEANPRWPCVWHTLAFVAHDGRASTCDMCSDHTAGCSV